MIAKEREISPREIALAERGAKFLALVAKKDVGSLHMHNVVSTAQCQVDAGIRAQ